MAVRVLSDAGPAEGSLKSERVEYIELSVDHNSASSFLVFLNFEVAI